MKEQDDILEQLFRENLHDAEMPVSEGLWTRIKKSIDNNRKKKFIIWLSLFAIAALASFYFISNSNNTSEKIANTKNTTIKIENKENRTNAESQEILNKNNQKEEIETTKNNSEPRGKYYSIQLGAYKNMSEEKLSELPDSLRYEKDINGLTKILYGKFANSEEAKRAVQKLDKNSNAFIAEYENGERKGIISKYEIQNSGTPIQQIVPNNNTLIASQNGNGSNPENDKSTAVKAFESNSKEAEMKNNSLANDSKNNSKEEKATQNEIKAKDLIAEQVKTPKDSAAEDNQTQSIAKIDSAIVKETKADSAMVIAKSDSAENKIIQNKKDSVQNLPSDSKWTTFLGVEGGLLLPYANYSSPNSLLNEEIKNGIKQKSSYNALLNFGVVFKNRINVFAGVGISDLQSDYSLNKTYTYNDTITIPIFDSLGNQIGSYDSLVNISQSISHNSKFHYQFLNIPIHIEFILKLGKKFKLIPGIGAIFTYVLSAKSSWIDPKTNSIIYDDKKRYKSSFFSGVAGLKLEYGLAEKWGVYFSPTYTIGFRNIYKDNNLKIRPASINLNVGARYYFGKKIN